jgi:hypothetical protein
VGVLDRWKLTLEELDEILSERPSLRGITFGYVGEYKLRKMWFRDERIKGLRTYDNHDRARKGDLTFFYKGVEISVEVKSLQTASISREGDHPTGKFQCDVSDRRRVILPNRDEIQTTCLLVGEFDLLAVNLFEFHEDWLFAFAKNKDLPRSRYAHYTPEQREHLLATLIEVTWPLNHTFEAEPFALLDDIAAEKQRGTSTDEADG